MKLRLVALLTVVLALPGVLSADTTYDTTYAWNGSDYIFPFGPNPNTATYGQTFIAPSVDNVLQNFTFYLNGPAGTTLGMEADVFAWSGSLIGNSSASQGATGSALFTSSFTFSGSGAFVPVTITTGGVTLTSGDAYVALFTISNGSEYTTSTGTIIWGDVGPYPSSIHVLGDGGGGFNFDNNGNNYAALNTIAWNSVSYDSQSSDFADYGDLAWTADFTPEPTSILLFGSGLLGLFAKLRKRA